MENCFDFDVTSVFDTVVGHILISSENIKSISFSRSLNSDYINNEATVNNKNIIHVHFLNFQRPKATVKGKAIHSVGVHFKLLLCTFKSESFEYISV